VVASTKEHLEMLAEIEEKIKKNTENIEEASESKDYLDAQATNEIEKLKVEIKKNGEVYELL